MKSLSQSNTALWPIGDSDLFVTCGWRSLQDTEVPAVNMITKETLVIVVFLRSDENDTDIYKNRAEKTKSLEEDLWNLHLFDFALRASSYL